jgi:hypothetical protein
LILSGGPDLTPGVFVNTLFPNTTTPTIASQLLLENNAMPFDPGVFNGETIPAGTQISPSSNGGALRDAGKDDITNQNRTAGGGPGGS